MNPRREFIRSVAVAATFALARPVIGAANAAGTADDSRPGGIPNYATFERLKGTKFRVSGARVADQWLELDQVLNVAGDARLEAISLRFKGHAALKLQERIYRFAHPDCGTFDFYITPGTTDAGRCSYRAVICRLI